MKRVSVLVASSVLFAVSGSSVEAAQVASRDGCVNLRSQPSINAGVIRCLPPGTNLEPYRSPGSGRFTWQKEGDRVWYYTSVPGTSEKGWIMPVCTDINGSNQGTCTDIGSVAPLAKPQQPQAVAQAEQQEEFLKNPSWKVVPGAAVGKNPADTLMNLNSLNRNGNQVTFDIIGYQGSYNRLEGNCSDRQVRFLRRGIYRGLRSGISEKGALDLYVNYRSATEKEASEANEFHRKILDFACKQSQTQVASSPAKGSTQAVGNYQCQKIQGGSSAIGNPIQKATLEPRSGGYTLKFTEMVQGQPIENVWELDNRLLIGNVRFYNPDDNTTPVKIQPTGEFSKTFMASSEDKCTWTGTLQFVGNAQAQLFTGASAQAQKPAQPASSTAKIAEGVYWVGATGMGVRVRNGQYQRYDEGGESPWKPISELTAIKDGVVKAGDTYWCLSTLPQPQNSRSSVCSANGWTPSPSVASKPSLSVSPMKPSTSVIPSAPTNSPTQAAPAPTPSSSADQLAPTPQRSSPPTQPPSNQSPSQLPQSSESQRLIDPTSPSATPKPSSPPSPKSPKTEQPQPPSQTENPSPQPPSQTENLPKQPTTPNPILPVTQPAQWLGGAPGDGGKYFPNARSACQTLTRGRKLEALVAKHDDINRFVSVQCDVEGLETKFSEETQPFCPPGYHYKGEIDGVCILVNAEIQEKMCSKKNDEVVAELQKENILPRRQADIGKAVGHRLVQGLVNRATRLGPLGSLIPAPDTLKKQNIAGRYSVECMVQVENYLLEEFKKAWENLDKAFRDQYGYTPQDDKFLEWVQNTSNTDIPTRMDQKAVRQDYEFQVNREKKFQENMIQQLRSFRDIWVRPLQDLREA